MLIDHLTYRRLSDGASSADFLREQEDRVVWCRDRIRADPLQRADHVRELTVLKQQHLLRRSEARQVRNHLVQVAQAKQITKYNRSIQ